MTSAQKLSDILAEIGRRDVEHNDAMARLRAEAVRLHTQASADALAAERQRREAAERGLVAASNSNAMVGNPAGPGQEAEQ